MAIKKIDEIINKNEKILLTLVDEYYDESDFKDFCNAISTKDFTTLVAIKELNFPDEYLKNYAVTLDEDNEVIKILWKKVKKLSLIFLAQV